MVVFQRFEQSALFLLPAGIANPASARVGLLLVDAGYQQDSFTVSASTWTEAWYVFFTPSATRDWSTFTGQLRNLFTQTSGMQVAFLTESQGAVSVASSLVVDNSGGSVTLLQPAQFKALNVTVNVQAQPMNPPAVEWDDVGNQFTVANLSGGSAAASLSIQGAVSGSYNQPSFSDNLLLPLTGDLAGCLNAGYPFALNELDTVEAGLLYFAPPASSGDPLTALHYPLVHREDDNAKLKTSFWFDVLAPGDPLRSYFQTTDPVLGTYFASANGQAFTLTTTSAGDTASLSRFVLANRPVQSVAEQKNFYLCPAGTFGLTPAASAQNIKGATGPTPVLLCGISGTEFFQVAGDAQHTDSLTFVPGQAAYAAYDPASAALLADSGGNTVTSWVQFGTAKGAYVSQPEESPLYEQGGTLPVQLAANASPAHLLNFLPLATWQPPKQSTGASTPAVPLVPYSGIPDTADLAPFRTMETAALNPTRRNLMMGAQHNTAKALRTEALTAAPASFAMTPQGLLAGLTADTPPAWTTLQIATSAAGTVQLTNMGTDIQNVLQQNRIFLVDTTLTGPDKQTLFSFAGSDQQVNISDWIFNLSPADPTADPASPPVLLFKFWDGQTISDLVDDTTLWSSPDIFNNGSYTAEQAQTFLQGVIAAAKTAVDDDPESIYANFYNVVTDPSFAGILAINGSLQLNNLPTAIQAVMGGMTYTNAEGKRVSNLDKFRAHHIGIQINDTDASAATPTLSQSSFFALVDYEKPSESANLTKAEAASVVPLGFEVEYLRALFTNSELRSFDCLLDLMLNQLFDVGVTLDGGGVAPGDDGNVVAIRGTYQNHSSGQGDGEGIYSFVAEKTFDFTFSENSYLKSIELTKLQFSFQSSAASSAPAANGSTHIDARFSLWGSLAFNALNVLDLFSFDALSFADLGITVSFDVTLDPPSTTAPVLTFSPGDLRLDLGQTKPREGSDSLLSLLPFRLTSFLYSQHADQTLSDLNYFALSSVPGLSSVADTFNYALTFDLDLGSAGDLVGSLAAFKFSFLLGWLNGGGVAFGVQMPEADGKLEIKIQGVFDLLIEDFVLRYVDTTTPPMLVIGMINTSVQILGKRLPPTGNVDFVLFKPQGGEAQIGWMFAYDNTGGGEGAARSLPSSTRAKAANDEEGSSFNLKYLGLGQRVGPDPTAPPTTFASFLTYMTKDFIDAFKAREYDSIYHPDGKWLIVADAQLLKILELGFIFYDVTPFYSLMLDVQDLFTFEITYTKVTDTIGLYFANLTLPEKLRTFQAGAASLTLPGLEVSIYTNGNWKVNLGFPNGDDWSVCFRLDFMAGPVPVTGSGGLYLASMSSATLPVFQSTDYATILAFGLAARVGVGKSFTAGPLSAGVSITFFGIIEGAAGYLSSGETSIFHEPKALKLTGQFGLIGEIYGSIDFVIIKASVNVTLSASVGIVLYLEAGYGDGSILLYIEATVSVSVSVSISLVFFSITISFSYDATFRFQWQLEGSSSAAVPMLAAAPRPRLGAAPAVLPLLPGFTTSLPLWFLPELTTVFADTVQTGVPSLAFGLAVEFDPAPKSPTYATLKPFEALTTQLTTWALIQALSLSTYNAPVAQTDLRAVNEDADRLIGFLTYQLLLQQLAVFNKTTVTVPSASANAPQTASAATFPMLPFLQLATSGRLDGKNKPADLTYVFSAQNLVSSQYLPQVDAYLDQLFVNASKSGAPSTLLALGDTATPLTQQVFVEYFSGLVRGAVNQLLQTMENQNWTSQPLDQVICSAVAAGKFAALGGQMSSMFRSGARLPFTAGLTIPGGTPATDTNPMQSLLWQQFPVGTLSPVSKPANGVTAQYTVAVTQPDTTQPWVTTNVSYALTNLAVDPFSGLTAAAVTLPQSPTLIPFTNSGPQAFSFANRITWTQGAATQTLCAFPPAMLALSSSQTVPLAVLVQSRQAGSAYAPDGQPLPASSFRFATTVQLIAQRVTDGSGAQSFLPNVYSISGSSQAEQALLAAVLQSIGSVASIQVLYQTAAGAAGLTSATVNNPDIFLLRTNTTTVSAPPPQLLAALAAPPQPTISVGANVNDAKGFVQILEEVSITNAPGYYLHYKTAAGGDLPPDLFNAGPAPITLLLTFTPVTTGNTSSSPSEVQPYYNTLVLESADPSLVYYATTVDPQFNLQYASVAAGSVGAALVRSQSSTLLRKPDASLQPRQAFLAEAHAACNDAEALHAALLAAGAAPAQLNSLYSLLTFQVQASAGFILSNLSAPVQPQAPAGSDPTAPRTYRTFVPLYAVATANQTPSTLPPNRYASLGDSYSVNFRLTDAFGNQHPRTLSFSRTNLYFDSIKPLDEWQGIVPTFDFSQPQANTVNVTLSPSQSALGSLTGDRAKAALALYETISTQINGPGVTFTLASSLSLAADGSYAAVKLSTSQAQQVTTLINSVLAYLQAAAAGTPPAWNIQPVSFSVALPTSAGALPPAFGLVVQFGIERDIALIDSSLIGPGNVVTLPSAQRVSTTLTPASTAQSATAAFAENFATAFPALLLAQGLGGAQDLPKTAAARQRKSLRAFRQAADPGVSTGESGSRALWAIARSLVEITIDNASTHQPLYSAPKPLLNALESGTVPMPAMPAGLKQLGAQQTFVDVDLDNVSRNFFAAVDQVLQPGSAAALFAASPTSYTTIAYGRERLAIGYSNHQFDWLFDDKAPFTGSTGQRKDARGFLEQQCRAALMSAYAIDTVMQFPVTWKQTLPAAAAGNLTLFGSVQPVSTSGTASRLTAFPCAQIEVPAQAGSGLFTFAYCSPDVVNDPHTPVALQFTVSHVQVFTAPDPGNDQARPSLWLQLITPPPQSKVLPNLTIPVGPSGTPVTIPMVLRQYPTPPTLVAQSGKGAGVQAGSPGETLQQAAGWLYAFRYQAQITSYDRLIASITWNTATAPKRPRALALGDTVYTLFEALCRFAAAYPILQPVLANPKSTSYADAAAAFASLVNDVASNSDWNPTAAPPPQSLGNKQQAQDRYVVQDIDQGNGTRTATLTWGSTECSMPGGQLAITAVAPNGTPYTSQQVSTLPNGLEDIYTPVPAIVDDWVSHQLSVSGIDVLTAENARPAVQIERNRIELASGSTTYSAQDEFVYMTPLVQPAEPVTPFLDNSDAVNVATLPQLAPGTACSSATPATLCQRVYNMLLNLLTLSAQPDPDPSAAHRLKVGCSFSYPLSSAAGLPPANDPIMPLVPVVFARSFDINDTQMQAQLGAFAVAFAENIQAWTAARDILFGQQATPTGGQLVFDVTLFAQLSGNSRPLLRLRNLQLALGDVAGNA